MIKINIEVVKDNGDTESSYEDYYENNNGLEALLSVAGIFTKHNPKNALYTNEVEAYRGLIKQTAKEIEGERDEDILRELIDC